MLRIQALVLKLEWHLFDPQNHLPIILALNNIPLCGCVTAYLSTYLLQIWGDYEYSDSKPSRADFHPQVTWVNATK